MAQVLAESNGELLSRLRRVDAVDGRGLDLRSPELLDYVTSEALQVAIRAQDLGAHTIVHKDGELVKFHDHLTQGGIACAMSHHKALRLVASHPTAEWALILEDDVADLVPRAPKVIDRMLQHLPADWEALFLGYHGGVLAGSGLDAQQEQLRAEYELQIDEMRGWPGWRSGATGCLEGELPVLRMYSPLYGLYAWVVRKSAAEQLLKEAFPVEGQVDHALSKTLAQRGRSFKVAPRHMLFYSPKSETALDSDIQTMTHLDELLADPEHCERYVDFVKAHGGES